MSAFFVVVVVSFPEINWEQGHKVVDRPVTQRRKDVHTRLKRGRRGSEGVAGQEAEPGDVT